MFSFYMVQVTPLNIFHHVEMTWPAVFH